jgi:hypothetical protein
MSREIVYYLKFKQMKNLLLSLLCIGVFTLNSSGQGCVAVRHMSCSVGTGANTNSMMHPGQWQVSLGFRNLHSFCGCRLPATARSSKYECDQ